MIRPKNPKIGRWNKNEGSKPRSGPKVTFDILIAKYKGGKDSIKGHKNEAIWFPKPDYPVSLDQASTSAAGSSYNNQSRTPSRRNSEA
jgi:hypothetical protein